MFRYCSLLSLPLLFFFFTTEFINILLLSLKREGGGGVVQAIFVRVRLCERRHVAKNPHDLSPKYLGFSLCRAYMYVARCHWITFCIISKCQTFYSFSIYLKPSLHTYFSLFHVGFLPST